MNNSIKFVLLFSLLFFFNSLQLEAQFWNLVWADEFSGTAINPSNWTMETGAGGWGNNEWQYYTNRPENASIQNGQLAIVAKKENYAGSNYTSARMITKDKQSWKYGKIEARIKFPLRQGIWPAFWMLGSNFSTIGWPQCGEIDIMEHINTSDEIHGTIHWDVNGHASYGGSKTILNVNQFHTYAIEWDASGIQWFVDGVQYWTANTLNNINSTEEFHEPFFLILNMAVGGNWPGYPNTNDAINDTMLVDYIRVYENGSVPSTTNHLSKENKIVCYPNPIKQKNDLRIKISESGIYSIKLINQIGQTVYQSHVSISTLQGDEQTLPTSSLNRGIYFLQIKKQEYTKMLKVQVQ